MQVFDTRRKGTRLLNSSPILARWRRNHPWNAQPGYRQHVTAIPNQEIGTVKAKTPEQPILQQLLDLNPRSIHALQACQMGAVR